MSINVVSYFNPTPSIARFYSEQTLNTQLSMYALANYNNFFVCGKQILRSDLEKGNNSANHVRNDSPTLRHTHQ